MPKKGFKKINSSDDSTIETIVDRDTSGSVGAVGIADTIFNKINKSDIFICDVSFINSRMDSAKGRVFNLLLFLAKSINKNYFEPSRITPNPNVMAEVGFAASKLGWNKIILVMNAAYGSVEDLPFDLRGRRVIQYQLSRREHRKDVKIKLAQELEAALKNALNDIINIKSHQNAYEKRWFGYWRTSPYPNTSKILFINDVGIDGFYFNMALIDGARTGDLEGYAKFIGPDSAHAFVKSFSDQRDCEIKFRRIDRELHIQQGSSCHSFMGMGASFDGIYIADQDVLFNCSGLREFDLQRLYSIMGKYYYDLQNSFQNIYETEDIDNLGAKVYSGGVKGLYTITEGIIMKSPNGHIWSAFIDGDFVRYFTTSQNYKSIIPKTFERWMDNFSDKSVIFENNVNLILDFFNKL